MLDPKHRFSVPACIQVKPGVDEVRILQANGYVDPMWVFDPKTAPPFIDGSWNRERRGLGCAPSIPVSNIKKTASNHPAGSRDDQSLRRSRSPSLGRGYGQSQYRDRSPMRKTYRPDPYDGRQSLRYRSPSRHSYRSDHQPDTYRSRESNMAHRRSRRSRSPSHEEASGPTRSRGTTSNLQLQPPPDQPRDGERSTLHHIWSLSNKQELSHRINRRRVMLPGYGKQPRMRATTQSGQ
jgi:hypothetical protein